MKESEIKDIYTLSPLQEGILFHSIYQKNDSAYFVQMAYTLTGQFDVNAAQSSLQQLIERHDVLRSSFVYEGLERPYQVVLHSRKLPFEVIDTRNSTAEESRNFLNDFKQKDKELYFDLSKDCLMRATVILAPEDKYEFIWSYHHIIIDGWCLKTLENEFFLLYNAFSNNQQELLPAAPQYKEYISWLDGRPVETARNFWSSYLATHDTQSKIPTIKYSANSSAGFRNHIHEIIADTDLHQNLIMLARKNRTTLNVVLSSIWGILLAKYHDQRKAIFGSVVSGRPPALENADNIVGLFINTVPVFVEFESETKVCDLLSTHHQKSSDATEFHYYPLVEIQGLSPLKEPLFDHILVFENYPVNQSIDGLSIERSHSDGNMLRLVDETVFSQNHYPFYLIIGAHKDLKLRFFYDNDRYDKSFVQQLCQQFIHLIRQCVANDQILVDSLEVVDKNTDEYNKLVNGFHSSDVNFGNVNTIKECFEDIANQFSERLAISAPGTDLTYKQLNEISNQVAWKVRKQVKKESPRLGILTNHPLYAVVAMVSAAKSGMMFVPIHPSLPVANVHKLLIDTEVDALILDSDMLASIPPDFLGLIVALDVELNLLDESIENFPVHVSAADPLYTIFSSGTTGQPKGITISNESLLNYAHWLRREFNIQPDDRGVLVSSYAFDLGYTVLWGCLLSGASLYLPTSQTVQEPEHLQNYIYDNKITFIKLTPSHFKIILTDSPALQKIGSSEIRLVILGGENIAPKEVKSFLQLKKNITIVNHYGPTETTIGTIVKRIPNQALDEYEAFPVIGQSIANSKALILDVCGNLLPPGAKGDLYIGGKGLSSGYLSNPSLTENKFRSLFNQRLYHTGDKAVRLLNGDIVFLGRKDGEVKMNGYRINTIEIENLISEHPSVQFCSIQLSADKDNISSLTAYLKCTDSKDESSIVSWTRERLPFYMTPHEFVYLTHVPLTANGKVDFKKLRDQFVIRAERIIPANETEARLHKIWLQVLEKEAIGTNENFFELGGHSLKAVQVASRVTREFGIRLEVKDMFAFTTIAELSKAIEAMMVKADEEMSGPIGDIII